MAVIIFADGLLEETPEKYRYMIKKEFIPNVELLDQLYESDESYEMLYTGYESTDGFYSLTYEKPEEADITTLDEYKKKSAKKKKVWRLQSNLFAKQMIQHCYDQQNEGFYVLPIPENFLVVNRNTLYHIYKAVDGLPITGFDFKNYFSEVQRMIFYLYSNYSFNELLSNRKIVTEDENLLKIASTSTFEELYFSLFEEELPKQTNDNSSSYSPVIDETQDLKTLEEEFEQFIEPKIEESIEAPEINVSVENKPSDFIQKKVRQTDQVNAKKSVVSKHDKEIKSNRQRKIKFNFRSNKLMIGVLIFSSLSLLLNVFLVFDKVTYPSNLTYLQEDNRLLQDEISQYQGSEKRAKQTISEQKERIDTLEDEASDREKQIEDLKEEISDNVEVIKEVLNKNEELKKEISKK